MNQNNNCTLDEVLFWKVFRNIYLFQNIINQIPLLSVEFRDITRYDSNNYSKFKDISRLEWFFNRQDNKEGALKLLKFKIKHKEEFEIGRNGLSLLIRKCKDLDVLEYIFENYQIKFIEINTIGVCSSSNNRIAFDFFMDKIEQDPYLLDSILPIHQSTIENALQQSNLHVIQRILKMAPTLDISVKNLIFKLASFNKNRSEIIQFLISNPQYYS